MPPVTRFYVTYVGPLDFKDDGPRMRTFPKNERIQVTHEEFVFFESRSKSFKVDRVEIDEPDIDPVKAEEELQRRG